MEGPKSISVSKTSYYARNDKIAHTADSVIAFHVNASQGTQNTIDCAKKLGKKTKIFRYKVTKLSS